MTRKLTAVARRPDLVGRAKVDISGLGLVFPPPSRGCRLDVQLHCARMTPKAMEGAGESVKSVRHAGMVAFDAGHFDAAERHFT